MTKLKQLLASRHLIWTLAYFRLKNDNKTRSLGLLWGFLDPLLYMITYTILVKYIFGLGSPQYPILLFTALVSWSWFTQSLGKSVTALSSRTNIILRMRVPLIIFPVTEIFSESIQFLFGIITLIPLLFYFEANLTINLLYLPLILSLELLLIFGGSLICTVLGTYLKDMSNILSFAFRLTFYLSPALYSAADRVPERFQTLFFMNPFAWLFESYKSVVIYGTPPNWHFVYIPLCFGIAMTLIGLYLFTHEEPKMAKAL